MAKNDDERKARARYIDQPGQWVDTTPKSVKKRQDKAWAELMSMDKKQPAKKKKTGKK
jgi:hypothetical protein